MEKRGERVTVTLLREPVWHSVLRQKSETSMTASVLKLDPNT